MKDDTKYNDMANDPAFLFYPGDYLRDTQCLSEKTQVAYDRIMCEHMRNICITPAQLKFFAKRLSEEELAELKMVLAHVPGGYQIAWVAESISKRKLYSESRRKNRSGKTNNISESHVEHVEIEIENENVNVKEIGKENGEAVEFMAELNWDVRNKKINFPFSSTEFMHRWNKLIAKSKWKKKTPETLQRRLDELKPFPEAYAIQILIEAFDNDWQGLVFESTQRKYEQWSKKQKNIIENADYTKDFRGH